MDTLVIETHGRLMFTNAARVVRAGVEVSDDLAAASNFQAEKSNPFLKWIVGDFVEADNPNSNTQFWTKDDLAMGEYSIKYSPLNMLHKQQTPVGFFASTQTIPISGDSAAQGTAKIEALAGMWSHVFPFESALVDQADEMGQLFYCVDPQTEMLTLGGWKRYDELVVDELVYTMNPHTGLAGWQPLRAVNTFDYDGDLISFEGQQHSSLTTANHRWVIRHRESGRVEWRTTDRFSQACGIPRAVPQDHGSSEAKFRDEFVELLAWFWTEGTVSGTSVTLYQSHVQNPAYAHRIAACLKQLFGEQARVRDGGKWYATQHGKMTHFHLCKEAALTLIEFAPDKIVDAGFLASLTSAQLRLFIETAIDADGSRAACDGQVALTQRSEARIRSFEMACALAGIPTNTQDLGDGFFRICLVRRGMYVYPKRNADLTRLGHRTGSRHEKVPYQGVVWCPTTPNGTFLARRRGTVYWTGNSMECRGSHLHCAGPNGCDQTFEYMATETHCQHLMERSSIRHIVNPTFRGGALIIPPTRPGWKGAEAHVMEDSVRAEAARYAEQTEAALTAHNAAGGELTASQWEHLMATVVTLGQR